MKIWCKGDAKPKNTIFNRFKSCFDTASLKISTRAFRIRIQLSKKSIGRRAVIILLQEKNFGPNVIYYVSAFIDNNTTVSYTHLTLPTICSV